MSCSILSQHPYTTSELNISSSSFSNNPDKDLDELVVELKVKSLADFSLSSSAISKPFSSEPSFVDPKIEEIFYSD